ncbi:hypothetical protein AKJ63_02170 [candidate division MSBL1 archaeon SCGC-AAA259D18]|uniref:5,10-methylenetetrahydromethanopterin reductase n=1 Tax=candidate division MSBL1 archaeon SCGC-AAA259D18 TaxID=1698262 RepID=A0A133U9J0_9EURY|nr:hypothetical protein AKJ63_02170 [candidate division MSBL1 archaeon SCGC-AAA259D18]
MKFGAEIVPYYSPKKLRELGDKIEEAKFDYLWVSDHYHNRYVHSILAQLSDATEKIQLGPGVTNPYLIHPSVTAAAIATLDELSGGRATLGISAGDPSYLHSVGIEHKKPITTVGEAIRIIRGLLDGEKLDFSGKIFTCNGAKLAFSPLHDIPIYIGGRSEQMMKLAGEIADGALFNAAHPRDLEECTENVEKGAKRNNRNLEKFDKVAYMITSIDENEEKARDRARTVTSFVAASAPKSTLEREKLSEERIKNIQIHLTAGDTKKAREEVSERMIDVFSVSGTIDKLENRIEKLRKMGISQVVIGSPIGPEPDSAIDKIKKIIVSV